MKGNLKNNRAIGWYTALKRTLKKKNPVDFFQWIHLDFKIQERKGEISKWNRLPKIVKF